MGSVPADNGYSCLRNVTIKDSVFHMPVKAIYVKTNSANPGTTVTEPGSGGELTNILYENIEIFNPIWWGIYIGP